MSAPIHNRDLDNDLDHSSSVRIRDSRSNSFASTSK